MGRGCHTKGRRGKRDPCYKPSGALETKALLRKMVRQKTRKEREEEIEEEGE